jgi:peptidoglycan/xylan/chitin deacetylase (PgdA/CDA1 family)
LKLRIAGIIATVIVIVAGMAMISPLFFRTSGVDSGTIEIKQPEIEQPITMTTAPAQAEAAQNETVRRVMLAFSVTQSSGAEEWCQGLSALLDDYDIGASVFFTGKAAEQCPQCVRCFSDKVDIGSRTYNNVKLTDITGYLPKIREVIKGKTAVDEAGNCFSRIFTAPFGATDGDIYSVLELASIAADFSYSGQYNLFEDGMFIRFDAAVYEGSEHAPDFFRNLARTSAPLIINFNDTYPVTGLEAFIKALYEDGAEFVNASDLAGFNLTIR